MPDKEEDHGRDRPDCEHHWPPDRHEPGRDQVPDSVTGQAQRDRRDARRSGEALRPLGPSPARQPHAHGREREGIDGQRQERGLPERPAGGDG
ncbi:hypothetical protein GCM10009682_16190 [Luedemannella flava]|uniref:Uncharacterized protein n=1 Tax=Luedemannella flava TaxID=349316 RepID=A0ABN2LP53_9ACTN